MDVNYLSGTTVAKGRVRVLFSQLQSWKYYASVYVIEKFTLPSLDLQSCCLQAPCM